MASSDFQATIYEALSSSYPYMIARNLEDLTFDTELPGGFSTCSFSIPMSEWLSNRGYGSLEDRPIVIHDGYGRTIYEGTISSISETETSYKIDAVGHYNRATRYTFGLLKYEETPAKTNLDILKDAMARVPEWGSPAYFYVPPTLDSVTPQEFQLETKVPEVIEKMLQYGAKTDSLLFAIYENRMPIVSVKYVYPREMWFTTQKANINLDFGRSITMEGVYNKIQVVYQDKDGVSQFIDWKQDNMSVFLYGVREGSLNIGSLDFEDAAAATLYAQNAQDLALKYSAYPVEAASFTLKGSVNYLMSPTLTEQPYMIRAGTYIFITDVPGYPGLGVSRLSDGIIDQETCLALFINKTTYSAAENSIQIDAGPTRAGLDFWLSTMGISGGSIS